MAKAVYGHPKSGTLFVRALANHIRSGGWQCAESDMAVFGKGPAERVACYSDDILMSVKEEEKALVDLIT